MSKPFTLYWTNFRRYEECPQKFLWYSGWGAIDVGGGPGKKKPKPYKRSTHHALMGIVIAQVTENLYNDELWKDPTALVYRLKEMTRKEFTFEYPKHYIDPRMAPSREEMLKVCIDGVTGFVGTMKHNRLLGPYARSEVDLVAYVNKYTPIGGRADYIIRREDTGISILDGKNSVHKGKYTDPDQLRWYGLCFYLSHNVMPDRLGFVYFRYPYGTPKDDGGVESGVDWVEFSKDDFKGLAQRAADARKGMHQEKFDPTPTPSMCRLCDYEDVCEARQAQRAGNRRKPKNTNDLFDGADGLIEFGLTGGSKSSSGE